MRSIVGHAIRDHCRYRGWGILGLNVRTNHVHIVLAYTETTPEAAMSQLKAWSTRRLRESGLVKEDARMWTYHGSTRYLWTQDEVNAAIRYVLEDQGADLGGTAGEDFP